jgi:hypothetical protein
MLPVCLKGRDDLKRLIAMFLSTVLILMMSAFAFAAEYKVVIEEPDSDFELEDWDDTFFVEGYVQANSNDILNWIKITIKGDDDGESFSKTFMIDDSDFDNDGDDYDFSFEIEHPELWGIDEEDDYEITVTARIDPEVGSKFNEASTEVVEITFDEDMNYGAQLTAPLEDVVVTNWNTPILIKGWVMADDDRDEIDYVEVEIDGPGTADDKTILIPNADDWDFDDGNFTFVINTWKLDADNINDEFTVHLKAVIDLYGDPDDMIMTDSSTFKILFVDKDDDDDDDDDDGEDKVMDNYPAAPAVANKILKEMGISNRYRGTNLISEIARLMGPNTEFDGVLKTDVDDYEQAIRDYLEDRIEDLEDMETPPAPGNSANKGNGKNKGN